MQTSCIHSRWRSPSWNLSIRRWLLLATLLPARSLAAPAEATNESPPEWLLVGQKGEWECVFRGEYFKSDMNYSQEYYNFQRNSTQSGQLYTGTLEVKWPGLPTGDAVFASFGSGRYDGTLMSPSYTAPSQLDSDMTYFTIGFQQSVTLAKNADGIPWSVLKWSCGYSYTGWDTTETAPPGYIFGWTGTPYSHENANFNLCEVTAEYTCALLAIPTGKNSCLRFGPRAQGIVGVGFSIVKADWMTDGSSVEGAVDYGGKGSLFLDWSTRNLVIGIEGGYRYIGYTSYGYEGDDSDYYDYDYTTYDSYTRALHGPVATAYLSFRF
ncbi:MAG: hypothetical protein U1F98_17555 [Verrucomicrobiota bacterium]